MKTLRALIKRNVRLFFSDKALFLVSLITPAILLLLYVTFLGNVYTDSLRLAGGDMLSDELVDGFAGAQLISSILAVSCVTVSF
jgi:multidrug/hemolysin transport system permease protein